MAAAEEEDALHTRQMSGSSVSGQQDSHQPLDDSAEASKPPVAAVVAPAPAAHTAVATSSPYRQPELANGNGLSTPLGSETAPFPSTQYLLCALAGLQPSQLQASQQAPAALQAMVQRAAKLATPAAHRSSLTAFLLQSTVQDALQLPPAASPEDRALFDNLAATTADEELALVQRFDAWCAKQLSDEAELRDASPETCSSADQDTLSKADTARAMALPLLLALMAHVPQWSDSDMARSALHDTASLLVSAQHIPMHVATRCACSLLRQLAKHAPCESALTTALFGALTKVVTAARDRLCDARKQICHEGALTEVIAAYIKVDGPLSYAAAELLAAVLRHPLSQAVEAVSPQLSSNGCPGHGPAAAVADAELDQEALDSLCSLVKVLAQPPISIVPSLMAGAKRPHAHDSGVPRKGPGAGTATSTASPIPSDNAFWWSLVSLAQFSEARQALRQAKVLEWMVLVLEAASSTASQAYSEAVICIKFLMRDPALYGPEPHALLEKLLPKLFALLKQEPGATRDAAIGALALALDENPQLHTILLTKVGITALLTAWGDVPDSWELRRIIAHVLESLLNAHLVGAAYFPTAKQGWTKLAAMLWDAATHIAGKGLPLPEVTEDHAPASGVVEALPPGMDLVLTMSTLAAKFPPADDAFVAHRVWLPVLALLLAVLEGPTSSFSKEPNGQLPVRYRAVVELGCRWIARMLGRQTNLDASTQEHLMRIGKHLLAAVASAPQWAPPIPEEACFPWLWSCCITLASAISHADSQAMQEKWLTSLDLGTAWQLVTRQTDADAAYQDTDACKRILCSSAKLVCALLDLSEQLTPDFLVRQWLEERDTGCRKVLHCLLKGLHAPQQVERNDDLVIWCQDVEHAAGFLEYVAVTLFPDGSWEAPTVQRTHQLAMLEQGTSELLRLLCDIMTGSGDHFDLLKAKAGDDARAMVQLVRDATHDLVAALGHLPTKHCMQQQVATCKGLQEALRSQTVQQRLLKPETKGLLLSLLPSSETSNQADAAAQAAAEALLAEEAAAAQVSEAPKAKKKKAKKAKQKKAAGPDAAEGVPTSSASGTATPSDDAASIAEGTDACEVLTAKPSVEPAADTSPGVAAEPAAPAEPAGETDQHPKDCDRMSVHVERLDDAEATAAAASAQPMARAEPSLKVPSSQPSVGTSRQPAERATQKAAKEPEPAVAAEPAKPAKPPRPVRNGEQPVPDVPAAPAEPAGETNRQRKDRERKERAEARRHAEAAAAAVAAAQAMLHAADTGVQAETATGATPAGGRGSQVATDDAVGVANTLWPNQRALQELSNRFRPTSGMPPDLRRRQEQMMRRAAEAKLNSTQAEGKVEAQVHDGTASEASTVPARAMSGSSVASSNASGSDAVNARAQRQPTPAAVWPQAGAIPPKMPPRAPVRTGSGLRPSQSRAAPITPASLSMPAAVKQPDGAANSGPGAAPARLSDAGATARTTVPGLSLPYPAQRAETDVTNRFRPSSGLPPDLRRRQEQAMRRAAEAKLAGTQAGAQVEAQDGTASEAGTVPARTMSGSSVGSIDASEVDALNASALRQPSPAAARLHAGPVLPRKPLKPPVRTGAGLPPGQSRPGALPAASLPLPATATQLGGAAKPQNGAAPARPSNAGAAGSHALPGLNLPSPADRAKRNAGNPFRPSTGLPPDLRRRQEQMLRNAAEAKLASAQAAPLTHPGAGSSERASAATQPFASVGDAAQVRLGVNPQPASAAKPGPGLPTHAAVPPVSSSVGLPAAQPPPGPLPRASLSFAAATTQQPRDAPTPSTAAATAKQPSTAPTPSAAAATGLAGASAPQAATSNPLPASTVLWPAARVERDVSNPFRPSTGVPPDLRRRQEQMLRRAAEAKLASAQAAVVTDDGTASNELAGPRLQPAAGSTDAVQVGHGIKLQPAPAAQPAPALPAQAPAPPASPAAGLPAAAPASLSFAAATAKQPSAAPTHSAAASIRLAGEPAPHAATSNSLPGPTVLGPADRAERDVRNPFRASTRLPPDLRRRQEQMMRKAAERASMQTAALADGAQASSATDGPVPSSAARGGAIHQAQASLGMQSAQPFAVQRERPQPHSLIQPQAVDNPPSMPGIIPTSASSAVSAAPSLPSAAPVAAAAPTAASSSDVFDLEGLLHEITGGSMQPEAPEVVSPYSTAPLQAAPRPSGVVTSRAAAYRPPYLAGPPAVQQPGAAVQPVNAAAAFMNQCLLPVAPAVSSILPGSAAAPGSTAPAQHAPPGFGYINAASPANYSLAAAPAAPPPASMPGTAGPAVKQPYVPPHLRQAPMEAGQAVATPVQPVMDNTQQPAGSGMAGPQGMPAGPVTGRFSLPQLYTVLHGLRCPLTQEIMKDPVLAEDGNTYECAAIEEWFSTRDTSPVTHERLPSKHLVRNISLRHIIEEFGAAQYQVVMGSSA